MASKKSNDTSSNARPTFATSAGSIPGRPNAPGQRGPDFTRSATSDAQRSQAPRPRDFARDATGQASGEDAQPQPVQWPNVPQTAGSPAQRADAASISGRRRDHEGGPRLDARGAVRCGPEPEQAPVPRDEVGADHDDLIRRSSSRRGQPRTTSRRASRSPPRRLALRAPKRRRVQPAGLNDPVDGHGPFDVERIPAVQRHAGGRRRGAWRSSRRRPTSRFSRRPRRATGSPAYVDLIFTRQTGDRGGLVTPGHRGARSRAAFCSSSHGAS